MMNRVADQFSDLYDEDCPACHGEGTLGDEVDTCDYCQGTGEHSREDVVREVLRRLSESSVGTNIVGLQAKIEQLVAEKFEWRSVVEAAMELTPVQVLAVYRGMGKVPCAYCGEVIDFPSAEHWRTCAEHPVRIDEARIRSEERTEAEDDIATWLDVPLGIGLGLVPLIRSSRYPKLVRVKEKAVVNTQVDMTSTRGSMRNQVHFYLRRPDNHPFGIVVLKRTSDVILAASSICCDGDVWNRKLGMIKAVGRLDSPRARTSFYVQFPSDLCDMLNAHHPSLMLTDDVDDYRGGILVVSKRSLDAYVNIMERFCEDLRRERNP